MTKHPPNSKQPISKIPKGKCGESVTEYISNVLLITSYAVPVTSLTILTIALAWKKPIKALLQKNVS